MNLQEILKTLVKQTGPLPTFYLSTVQGKDGKWQNVAAITELRVVEEQPRLKSFQKPDYYQKRWSDNYSPVYYRLPKSTKPRPPKEKLVNKHIMYVRIDDEKYAAQAAVKEGRVPCYIIGEVDEKHAMQALVSFSGRAEIRNKHRGLLKQAFKQIRKVMPRERRYAWADPRKPNTLGWRVWRWDSAKQRLLSPAHNTVWDSHVLIVPKWDTSAAVRGCAGIHAAAMPYNWRKARLTETELNGYTHGGDTIVGVVERFGRYVLGTEGWRAEKVVIKALKVPTTAIGLAIEQAYPEVEVYYADR